jgi:hypothetical protein
MSIYLVANGVCATNCPNPPVQTQAPSFCDTKRLVTAPVIVGFLNCDVSTTGTTPDLSSPPVLAELLALKTAGRFSVKKVYNFNRSGQEWQENQIDPFEAPTITGATQTFAFEDNDFVLSATVPDVVFWDNKTKLANEGKLHLVTIFDTDEVIFHRASMNLKPSHTYDATGKNIVRRAFTAMITWSDREVRNIRPYIIAGAYQQFLAG